MISITKFINEQLEYNEQLEGIGSYVPKAVTKSPKAVASSFRREGMTKVYDPSKPSIKSSAIKTDKPSFLGSFFKSGAKESVPQKPKLSGSKLVAGW